MMSFLRNKHTRPISKSARVIYLKAMISRLLACMELVKYLEVIPHYCILYINCLTFGIQGVPKSNYSKTLKADKNSEL